MKVPTEDERWAIISLADLEARESKVISLRGMRSIWEVEDEVSVVIVEEWLGVSGEGDEVEVGDPRFSPSRRFINSRLARPYLTAKNPRLSKARCRSNG